MHNLQRRPGRRAPTVTPVKRDLCVTRWAGHKTSSPSQGKGQDGVKTGVKLKRLEFSIEAFRSTLRSLMISNRNFRQSLDAGFVPIGGTATRLLAGQSLLVTSLEALRERYRLNPPKTPTTPGLWSRRPSASSVRMELCERVWAMRLKGPTALDKIKNLSLCGSGWQGSMRSWLFSGTIGESL